jgi:hypothetical protein
MAPLATQAIPNRELPDAMKSETEAVEAAGSKDSAQAESRARAAVTGSDARSRLQRNLESDDRRRSCHTAVLIRGK